MFINILGILCFMNCIRIKNNNNNNLCGVKVITIIRFIIICFYLSRYHSVVKDLWWRHFMSILVSTFQMMGAILYCGGEAYDGFNHVPLVS